MFERFFNSEYQAGADRRLRVHEDEPTGDERLLDMVTFYGKLNVKDQMLSGREFVRVLHDISFLAACVLQIKDEINAQKSEEKAKQAADVPALVGAPPDVPGAATPGLSNTPSNPNPGGRDVSDPQGKRDAVPAGLADKDGGQ